jgi:ABC-type sugar transport system permease subunit
MASVSRSAPGVGENVTLWSSFRDGVRASGIPWLFIVPSLLVMLVITFYPQAVQIVISFYDYGVEHLTGAVPADFVGLQNYQDVLGEGLNVPNYSFFPLLGFNIMWTLVNVALHVVIGLLVAMVLNSPGVIGRRMYRTLFVIPWGLPILISGMIWNNMWQRNGGGINLLAESVNDTFGTSLATDTDWLGSQTPPIDLTSWLGGYFIPLLIIVVCGVTAILLARGFIRKGVRNSKTGRMDYDRIVWNGGIMVLAALAAVFTLRDVLNGLESTNLVIDLFDRAGAPMLAYYAVLGTNIWLGWPFMMVVATGALQSIPPDLYEAADVDGANRWEKFSSITLPLIRPAMVPAIMLGTIWTFNQFNVIFFISNGGPRGQTELLITQAYKLIQQQQLYGAAAAFSIIVFFVLFIITLINNRVTRATEAYDEG